MYYTKPQYLLERARSASAKPYLSLTGTSMAAPVVTGTVALMLQANPSLTPNMVKAILQYTAQIYPGYNVLTQGAGFLNTQGAVQLARFYKTAQAGSKLTIPTVWSKQVLWGNHRIKGGVIRPNANAFQLGTTWGAFADRDGDNIVWGTLGSDNLVWGTVDLLTADNLVWGTVLDSDGDNLVWGTCGTATTWCGARCPATTTSCGAPIAAARTATTWSGAPRSLPTTWCGARRFRLTTWCGAPRVPATTWCGARAATSTTSCGASSAEDDNMTWGNSGEDAPLFDDPDCGAGELRSDGVRESVRSAAGHGAAGGAEHPHAAGYFRRLDGHLGGL